MKQSLVFIYLHLLCSAKVGAQGLAHANVVYAPLESFISVCVCAHVHACMCACVRVSAGMSERVHMCLHVEARGQHQESFKCHPPYFLRQGLTWGSGGLLIRLNCLASEAQGPSPRHLPSSGTAGVQCHTLCDCCLSSGCTASTLQTKLSPEAPEPVSLQLALPAKLKN